MGNWIPPAPAGCCTGENRTSRKRRRSKGRDGTSESSNLRTTPAPSLRENMTRERKNRDPLLYYEPIRVLGSGSMGSVSKVRKRPCVIRGKARPPGTNETKTRLQDPFLNRLSSMPIVGACVKLSTGHYCREAWSLRSPNESGDSRSSDSFPSRLSGRNDLLQVVPREKAFPSPRTDSGGLSTLPRSAPDQRAALYALKSIHLDRVHDPAFVNELKNEIEILKSLDHPHIIRPIETFEHRKELYMVMELCDGGDLFSRDPYSEEEAARIVHSILSAVAYMHARNVIHRDLKYENIMFANKSPSSEIKLIDFGLSKKFGPENQNLSEEVGTMYTMAPEVLIGDYTSQADVWSVGVLAFMLLSSRMPFYGSEKPIVAQKIMNCEYHFKGKRWKRVTKKAKKFVSSLLRFDPGERPTAEEALHCAWLRTSGPCHIQESSKDNIQAALELYADYSKLKKLALMVVAHKSTSEEIGFLRKAFQKCDTEKDGVISSAEFERAFEEYGYSNEELEKMFSGADLDGTGKICYTEFLAATIEAHGVIHEERLAAAFDHLDSDELGYISTRNLKKVWDELPTSDTDAIINEADLTNDNRISYGEFLALWDVEQEEKREVALRRIESRRSSMTNSVSSSEGNSPDMDQGVVWEGDALEGEGSTSGHLYTGLLQFCEEKKQSE